MLGMLVRADHRGLATMTALMARCLRPERVLLVDMGAHSPTACHPDQFPDRWGTVTYDELLAGNYDWSPFLDGLSAVYTAEIPYDYALFTEASRRGIKTVLHVMPELDPYVRQPELLRPDVIALPTSWLASRYPDSPILPVPAEPWDHEPGELVVHVGSLAMKDRNGTRAFVEAARRSRWECVVRQQQPLDLHTNVRVEVADLPDSKDLYAGAAVVVIPRRYGGLSLPIQEAMAAGLPVLVGEHDPYAAVVPPEARIRSIRGRDLQTKGGTVITWNCAPESVAERIDAVMSDAGLRYELAETSRAWARANSWANVRAAWDDVLGSTVPA